MMNSAPHTEYRLLFARRITGLLLLSLASACEQPTIQEEYPVRLTITNNLVAPVTIAVDDVLALGLMGSGGSSPLTVLSTARWLTWKSAKPLDPEGRLIPDDVEDVRIALSALDRELEINNVIGGNTYITARFVNRSGVPVSIGVFDGAVLRCASRLPAGSAGATGFTQIGYYRLLAATEIRAYRDPLNCTGPHSAWTPAQIRDFAAGSGLVTLVLDVAP